MHRRATSSSSVNEASSSSSSPSPLLNITSAFVESAAAASELQQQQQEHGNNYTITAVDEDATDHLMDEQIRQFLYEVCIPFIVLLCVLAAVFNIAIFVSRFFVKSRSTSLELTYSLALSDTWTSIVIATSLFYNSYKIVVLKMTHQSICFSLAMEAFRTGGLLTAIFHLVALACVHYLQIVRPFDHARILSMRQVHIIIFFIWSVPPLALLTYFSVYPNQGFQSAQCMGVDFYESIYFRGQISLLIFVLMLLTCVVYWRLLSVVSRVRSKTAGPMSTVQAKMSSANGGGTSVHSGTSTSTSPAASSQRGRRTLVTACLIFGTFIFGWTPASLLFMLTANTMPLYRVGSIWVTVFSIIGLMNIMIKTLTNPIIYATRIPEIQQFVLQRVLRRCRARASRGGATPGSPSRPSSACGARSRAYSTAPPSVANTNNASRQRAISAQFNRIPPSLRPKSTVIEGTASLVDNSQP